MSLTTRGSVDTTKDAYTPGAYDWVNNTGAAVEVGDLVYVVGRGWGRCNKDAADAEASSVVFGMEGEIAKVSGAIVAGQQLYAVVDSGELKATTTPTLLPRLGTAVKAAASGATKVQVAFNVLAPGSGHGLVLAAASATIYAGLHGAVISNRGASGTITHTLDEDIAVGTSMTFKIEAAQVVRIEPGAANAFRVKAATGSYALKSDGKYLELAGTLNAEITITRDQDGNYVCTAYDTADVTIEA